ncbi:MAG: nitrilase family protein, partial [Bacteroidia bacterium]|nr:nitrilase family protein [Bacteroidia bacterium]
MRIALVQTRIQWHDPKANFNSAKKLIDSIEHADLIILPETWASGFTMKVHVYHEDTIKALELMKEWSVNKNAAVAGSLIFKNGDDYYNRLYIVKEGKILRTYDKKHLFAFAGEDRFYKAGNEKIVFDLDGWAICPQICYDLRFPAWCRNSEDYDLLIVTANWPNQRIDSWEALLKARAVENQAYVIGVNCVGEDIFKNKFYGYTSAYSYDGTLIEKIVGHEGVIMIEIEKQPM